MLFWSASKARPKAAASSGSGVGAQDRPRRRRRGPRRSCRGAAAWPARGWPRARSLPAAFSIALAATFSSTASGATSHLGLPATFCSSSWTAQRRPDLLVGDLERLEHRLLVDLLGAGLDHRDGLGGAGDDQVELRLLGLLQGRVDDELVAHQADAHGADRAGEGHLREHQRGGRAVEGEDVERVDLVHRQDRRDDLGLVAVALGPQRPDRPVGHARGQGRPVARARLALDEAAGDLARGVHPLLDVHRQREEVRARARRLRAHRRHQHHRVPRADDDRAVGLLGQLAGLERDRRIADLRGNDLYCHVTSLVCPAPLGRGASVPAPPWCRPSVSSSFCPSRPARAYLRRPSVFVSSRYPSRSVRCM